MDRGSGVDHLRVTSLSCSFFSNFFFLVILLFSVFSSAVGAPWRCGVLTTWSGIVGIGPPTWERAWSTSPEWGGGSSLVKTEPLQIALLLLFRRLHYVSHAQPGDVGLRMPQMAPPNPSPVVPRTMIPIMLMQAPPFRISTITT